MDDSHEVLTHPKQSRAASTQQRRDHQLDIITDLFCRTTASPPPTNQYVPYSRPPVPGSQLAPSAPENHLQRPQSAYGALRPGSQPNQQPSQPYNNQRPLSYVPGINTQQVPPQNAQELATSVYDSPIAPHNPQSAAPYPTSVYSPDEAAPTAPSYPAPSVPGAGAPPPLQPSGSAYDARQGLPSQGAGAAAAGGGAYKPYVPPNSAY